MDTQVQDRRFVRRRPLHRDRYLLAICGYLERDRRFDVVMIGKRDQRLKPQPLDLLLFHTKSRRWSERWRPVGARKVDPGVAVRPRLPAAPDNLGKDRDAMKVPREEG